MTNRASLTRSNIAKFISEISWWTYSISSINSTWRTLKQLKLSGNGQRIEKTQYHSNSWTLGKDKFPHVWRSKDWKEKNEIGSNRLKWLIHVSLFNQISTRQLETNFKLVLCSCSFKKKSVVLMTSLSWWFQPSSLQPKIIAWSQF